MRLHVFGCVLLAGTTVIPGSLNAGGDGFRAAATGAARELSRQLFFLQNTISLIPGPPMGRGLYQQCDNVQGDLIYFQQQLQRQVAREQLMLNFDKMDGKLQQLLDDIKGFEQWDAAMKSVARRVRAAEHDLQFALAGGAGAPAGGPKLAYRQTLALLTKSENFAGMVRYVFAEQAILPQWNADLAALSQAIAKLQSVQKNKAAPEDVKNQLRATDQTWEGLVARLKALPQGQYILLQSDAAQVDQVIFRLAQIAGIKIGRTPLPDPLAF
jgi:hypothetical protein